MDEFEQLLVLSHSDANVCLFKHVPGLQSKLSEMQDVFDKVDRLEFMVAKIKQDMDQLDRQLTQAESTVENSAPGLKSIVPFIFVRNLSKNNVCWKLAEISKKRFMSTVMLNGFQTSPIAVWKNRTFSQNCEYFAKSAYIVIQH